MIRPIGVSASKTERRTVPILTFVSVTVEFHPCDTTRKSNFGAKVEGRRSTREKIVNMKVPRRSATSLMPGERCPILA